jgi:membrane dipeptidase
MKCRAPKTSGKLHLNTLLAVAVGLLLFGCSEKRPVDRMNDDALKEYASTLAQRFIITDGHVDLPYFLKEKKFRPDLDSLPLLIRGIGGDMDFDRARKGGLDAPFMSIYIPSSYQMIPDFGKGLADSLMAMVHTVSAKLPDNYALALTPEDVRKNAEAGKISLPMGMENGAPIGKDLKNVAYFYGQGIRYVTLTHGKDNQICDSSYDTTSTWNGLSPFGRQVVEEMNKVGMMVDISHVSDSTFYQVIRLTKVPVIASHSSCRFFTPGWRRNMTDDMIRLLGKNGGVIQISFGSMFLDSTAHKNSALRDSIGTFLKKKGWTLSSDSAKSVIDRYTTDPSSVYSTVERVADHIDHVVQLTGIDHVGLGSDFDGVGEALPVGLTDVSMYPNLIYVLLKRGYKEEEIEKICGGNVLRVWKEIKDHSQQ